LAGKLGLSCRAARISAERLAQAVLPALALMHDGITIVVFRSGPEGSSWAIPPRHCDRQRRPFSEELLG